MEIFVEVDKKSMTVSGPAYEEIVRRFEELGISLTEMNPVTELEDVVIASIVDHLAVLALSQVGTEEEKT